MDESPPTESVELNDLLRWHGAWAAVVIAAAALMAASFRGLGVGQGLALGFGVLPGLAGLLLQRYDSERARTLLLLAWCACATLACVFTGGVTGPLAAWCLAPLAAASVFESRNRWAQGAALSLFAAAVAALLQLGGLAAASLSGTAGYWTALLGLLTTGLGLGAGAVLALRRAGARDGAQRSSGAALERILADQPHLLLVLDNSGMIDQAYGHAPQGIDGGRLPGRSLYDAATLSSRTALRNGVRDAVVSGYAEVDFAPAAAPDRVCAVALRRAPEGGLAAVVRDASRERWREAELDAARLEAEALNAGKSRFLANMSHELRTPLNAVMGFSDVMKARLFGDLSPRYAEYAEMIHESGGHLLDLINDVLDMSKIEAERYQLSLEDLDAREAISAALRLVRLQADNAGVSLRGVLPPTDLEAHADRRAIKQIVLNLVSNALKFTPRGGSVTVSAQGRGEMLEIVVSDTGVGIAPEDLERLGRPYEQAGDTSQRAQGTGLGLSLVRAFSELHGGGMTIESALGEGTSVTVRLPVLRPDKGDPDQPPGAKIIAFNAERR